MERTITNKLIAWKNNPKRKPLIVYGARQIGKTYTILEFANKQYRNVVYCNFESHQPIFLYFQISFDPK